MPTSVDDVWSHGETYDSYVGRWSRLVAAEFLAWLGAPPGLSWVDVGCGTGALTAAILATLDPASVDAVDQSDEFVAFARSRVVDQRAAFHAADARALPLEASSRDVVVSGLALNFVPDPGRAVAEFARVLGPGGLAAAYVWDYAGEMQMLRYFWDAAVALDPSAADLDEGRRFDACRPGPLADLWRAAGFVDVTTRAVDVPTSFATVDEFWTPFLSGQGPAPSYVATLDDGRTARLGERLRSTLPIAPDGTIDLVARAWCVKGVAARS